MSSSQRPGEEVAKTSQKKRPRSGNVPLAPASPKGQIRRFGANVVTKEGKVWYKKHTKASYFSYYIGYFDGLRPTCADRAEHTPPYQAIQHLLCGPQSMAQWTKHSGKRYHKSFPYTYMLRETHVWLKVVMNCLILGLHYMDITHDRARVHKGHNYAFGGLITKICRITGISKEPLDYMAPLYPTARHMRDELIMARMYGLEMLRHKTGGRPSTDLELGEVHKRYLLNDHAKALLVLSLEFWKPIENDIPTDEENLRTGSDMVSDSEEEIDPVQAGDEADGGDVMED
ncbi:hypothetical protein R3W88_026263 [Solanum pinnatisectum]|uniref:Uncharacterized protein n=1 Tax=Solanum pinnatisectum TaxID=50273 RepID=A0AAV9LFD4_9SOLN|nr:hypothetical protein R3W88_026263 [Solanum pinnatisectum]